MPPQSLLGNQLYGWLSSSYLVSGWGNCKTSPVKRSIWCQKMQSSLYSESIIPTNYLSYFDKLISTKRYGKSIKRILLKLCGEEPDGGKQHGIRWKRLAMALLQRTNPKKSMNRELQISISLSAAWKPMDCGSQQGSTVWERWPDGITAISWPGHSGSISSSQLSKGLCAFAYPCWFSP